MLKESPITWNALSRKGSAAKVLIDESDGADMLVVGSRGKGGFAGLHLGSVSQQVSAHARSATVAVVKGL
jgi:nucleotide-binding universal stress UspA family protein